MICAKLPSVHRHLDRVRCAYLPSWNEAALSLSIKRQVSWRIPQSAVKRHLVWCSPQVMRKDNDKDPGKQVGIRPQQPKRLDLA